MGYRRWMRGGIIHIVNFLLCLHVCPCYFAVILGRVGTFWMVWPLLTDCQCSVSSMSRVFCWKCSRSADPATLMVA